MVKLQNKILVLFVALVLLLSSLSLAVGAVIAPADAAVACIHEQLALYLGKDTPGAAVVLLQRDTAPFIEGFGYASIEDRNRLVTQDATFELGEISSLFVALAVYALAEEGKLSVDQDITAYLPKDAVGRLKLNYVTTLRHLLLGTAGFEGRSFDLIFDQDAHRFESLEKALWAEVPEQLYVPGDYYSASPFGIALAAYVVECVSGMRYEDYVRERLLVPLGMTETVLNPTEETAFDQLAVGHVTTASGEFAVGRRQGRSYGGLYPASGACSTAGDMLVLMDFLLFGEPSVLSDAKRIELLEATHKNGVFAASAPGLSRSGAACGAQGSTLCYGASLWLDADRGVAALVMTNAASSALLELPRLLCDVAYGVSAPGVQGELLDLSKLKGDYLSLSEEGHSFVGRFQRKNRIKTVSVTDDGNLSFDGVTLQQVSQGLFADAEGRVVLQVVTDAEGAVSRILSADGTVYRPAKLTERKWVTSLLFCALLALALWLVVLGVIALIRYLAAKEGEHPIRLIYSLPMMLSACMSLFVLLQVWVGAEYGGAVFSSFFKAFSAITLGASIGAMATTLVGLAASIFKKDTHAGLIRLTTALVFFVVLVSYWQLSPL